MPLSPKANAIRQHLVNTGRLNDWFGIAKTFLKKRRQYRADPDWTCDHAGLAAKLKTELSGQIADVNDGHWNERAAWLCQKAIPK